MNYYLDTNICIYFLKGTFSSLKDRLLSHSPKEIFIPSIVKAELLYGTQKSVKRKETLKKVLMFLEPYRVVEFGDKEAFVYATIRNELEKEGKPIGPNDLIIASTVIANNGILVTRNIKEFSRIRGLKIEDWTK